MVSLGIPVKIHKILEILVDFQSYSLSISYRISSVVHGGCVDIFWNSPLLNIDWSFKFLDLTVDEMTSVFTTPVMDIMLRYIPNKMIECHDKDPPWITSEIKTSVKHNTVSTISMSDRGVSLKNGSA